MKLIALLALTAAFVAGPAAAVDFAPATDGSYVCVNSCTGYVTSDGSKLSSASLTIGDTHGNFRLVLVINGTAYATVAPVSADDLTAGVTLLGADGTYRTATVTATTRRTCTRSGRGQTCVTKYAVLSGSF